jgi:hypothetical protein
MKKYLPLLLLLTACATPTTTLHDKQGKEVTCGGHMTDGGMLWYRIQESNDQDCVKNYVSQGYKIITPNQ